MEKIVNDARLMIKVCDLYYNQKYKHQQIAETLGISRPTVSRILACAEERKVVHITVNDLDTVKFWDIEQRLKSRYGLREAVVVDALDDDAQNKTVLGNAARKYLENCIQDGDKVGVSMGSTLYHTVYGSFSRMANNVTFVPLIGGMGQLRTELHSNHLAENLARAYGGVFLPLYAPARVSNANVRNHLKKEQSVAQVLQLHKELSVALVGIGYPNAKSSIKATGYYKNNEIESLIKRGVAGDICMQFFDAQGDTQPYKKDNDVIGIDLNKLKKIPYSIGVAGGKDKISAIAGAIKGRYINVLITDSRCAEILLENE